MSTDVLNLIRSLLISVLSAVYEQMPPSFPNALFPHLIQTRYVSRNLSKKHIQVCLGLLPLK